MDHPDVEPTIASAENLSVPAITAPTPPDRSGPQAAPADADPRLDQLAASVTALSGQLVAIEQRVQALRDEVACIPDSLRQLGRNVQGLSTSLAEPRLRSLLTDLLMLLDLVDQAGRAGDGTGPAAQWLRTIGDQMRQILRLQGLTEIVAAGRFDPTVHRAVEGVAVTVPEQDQQVLRVLRCGFRTERSVLRAADVVVARYVAPLAGRGSESAAAASEQ
jgi:molecular chaperone GrpE (heat shock protein)